MTKTPRSPTPQAAWVAVHPRGWMDITTLDGTMRDSKRKLVNDYSFGPWLHLTPEARWAKLRREGWTMQRVAVLGLSAYHDLSSGS